MAAYLIGVETLGPNSWLVCQCEFLNCNKWAMYKRRDGSCWCLKHAWYSLRQGMFPKPSRITEENMWWDERWCGQPAAQSQQLAWGGHSQLHRVLALLPQGPGSGVAASLAPLPVENHLSTLAPRCSVWPSQDTICALRWTVKLGKNGKGRRLLALTEGALLPWGPLSSALLWPWPTLPSSLQSPFASEQSSVKGKACERMYTSGHCDLSGSMIAALGVVSYWVCKMAQWLGANVSSNPGTHIVGEVTPTTCPLNATCVLSVQHVGN